MGKMKMIIKVLVLGSIFSLLFTSCLLFALFHPKRHFYKVGNMEFTFWVPSDDVYITPYKSRETIPKNDYIKTSFKSIILIFIGEDSTLYIFPDLSAEIKEINLTSYKFELFSYPNGLDAIRARDAKARSFYDQGYPYININLNEMYVSEPFK